MIGSCEFYKCSICGNIVELVQKGGGELVCCGKPMALIVSNTVEASTEKHIPVVTKKNNVLIVNVGSVEHPMTEEHYIQWIYLLGEKSSQRIFLEPTDKPIASFTLPNENVLAVYAYCNLHGLWKIDLDYMFEEIICSPEFPNGCK